MENLAPPVELLIFMRHTLEQGESLKSNMSKWIAKDSSDPWRRDIQTIVNRLNLGKEVASIINRQPSIYRRASLELLVRSLQGESVYNQVCLLEEESIRACLDEMDLFHLTLPIKTLLPLLLFQFPAFLLIVLAPLLLYIQQM